MEIIVVITLVIGVYAFIVAKNAHKKLDESIKLSNLAESILWNTLLENDLISEEIYQDARDRFNRNIQSTLTSDKKKRAQIAAIRALLDEKVNNE